MRKRFTLILLVLCVLLVSVQVRAAVVYDFDDGTLQGWTPAFTGGSLDHEPTGGNPDGFMSVSDSAGGERLLARAPGFHGDLTGITRIQWDEYIFNPPGPVKGTNIFIIGSDDGTKYQSDRSVLGSNTWITKFVDFTDPDSWTLVSGSGSSSLGTVMSNAEGLFINMGTSTAVVGLESGVDNIHIVPIPAALLLLGSALIGLLGLKRKLT